MDLGLQGKVVLITGGSKGIGLATATRFVDEGADVAIVARTGDDLEAAVADLRERSSAAVEPIAADLRVARDVERAVDRTLDRFGRLDVLVNVAGNAPGGRIEEVDDDAWAVALGLKFMAAVRATRRALPHLRRTRGCVVNVAGVAGHEPGPHQVTLGAANAALLNLTRAVARDVASDGVRVVAVVPGPTSTDRYRALVVSRAASDEVDDAEAERRVLAAVPDGRPARPDEVAATIAFLSSSHAAHITGVALAIDGGELHGMH